MEDASKLRTWSWESRVRKGILPPVHSRLLPACFPYIEAMDYHLRQHLTIKSSEGTMEASVQVSASSCNCKQCVYTRFRLQFNARLGFLPTCFRRWSCICTSWSNMFYGDVFLDVFSNDSCPKAKSEMIEIPSGRVVLEHVVCTSRAFRALQDVRRDILPRIVRSYYTIGCMGYLLRIWSFGHIKVHTRSYVVHFFCAAW